MEYPAGLLVLMVLSPTVFADASTSVDSTGFVAFKQIDSDRNGYVSRVEARSVAAVESMFDSADINNDGLLDRSEYTSVRMAREAN